MLMLTGFVVLLSVQEPLRNVVLKRVGDDSNELLNLIIGEFTSTTSLNKPNEQPTACEYQSQPSCKQQWQNDDQYP